MAKIAKFSAEMKDRVRDWRKWQKSTNLPECNLSTGGASSLAQGDRREVMELESAYRLH